MSYGTDFSYMRHNTENKNLEANKEYLKNLQNLAFQLSKYNKPLIVNMNGKLKNSSSALFTNQTLVYSSDSTVLSFNDIDFGMTLTMGSSYILSKLDYYLGTYLALTGAELSKEDVLKSGIGS